MAWKKFLVLVLPLILINCISFYRHPKGGFRPKKPNFTLNQNSFKYNSKIDTLAIYTSTDTLKYGNEKAVFFLKFYNNGRFFKNSYEVDSDSIKLYNTIKSNMRPGFIGYYLSNDSKAEIEYYTIDHSNKNNTEYVKQTGEIRGDSIIFKSRYIEENKQIYIKQKLDFVPEPSNW